MLDAYLGAAECYQRAGQIDKAEAVLVQATTAHPESAALQLLLGRILWHSGKYPPASAALTKAQELDPSDPEPLFYLGNIAVGEGRVAECLKLLERYLAMTPKNQQNVATAKDLIKALKK
jgi:cytochrome c-type biogenesis protein CcmH/NrfG